MNTNSFVIARVMKMIIDLNIHEYICLSKTELEYHTFSAELQVMESAITHDIDKTLGRCRENKKK